MVNSNELGHIGVNRKLPKISKEDSEMKRKNRRFRYIKGNSENIEGVHED